MGTLEPTQEHTQEMTKKENNPDEHNEDKYVKKRKQTCIMKLIRENPEMPKILELDDLQRKQLAELMLEYPTKEEQLEVKNNQCEQTGGKKNLHMSEMREKIRHNRRKAESPKI